jgi:crossover junction endodeoxyribonuclease RusA
MSLTVQLPWPSPKLHPNARVHWAVKSKAAKKARADSALLTRAKHGGNLLPYDGTRRIPVSIGFFPPDRRRRDVDGMLSALKSSLDGVADALMVDDNLFDLSLTVAGPVKGGAVVVEIGS